jgi:hypothetical protein
MLRERPLRVGAYEVLGRLDAVQGAHLGVAVFRAQRAGAPYLVHLVPRDRVASGAGLERYARLARTTVGLPAVVDVFDDDDHVALVFEAVDGLSLARVLSHLAATDGRLPDAAVGYLCHTIAATLAVCHAARDEDGGPVPLVHGQLAAETILVANDGRIVVLGLCPFIEGDEGLAGPFAEPPSSAWFAPEVRRGAPPSATSDSYGLSLLLRALLTGSDRPDPGTEAAALSMLRPDWPPSLAMSLDRGMLPKPSERATSSELARALASLDRDGTGRAALGVALAPLAAQDRVGGQAGPFAPESTDPERTALLDRGHVRAVEDTFPTLPRDLVSRPLVMASSTPPAVTTPPMASMSSVPASDERITNRAMDERITNRVSDERITNRVADESVAPLDEGALHGTLLLDASVIPELAEPGRLALEPSRLPGPMRAPSGSLAPRPEIGFLTVIDDGAPDPVPRPVHRAPPNQPGASLGVSRMPAPPAPIGSSSSPTPSSALPSQPDGSGAVRPASVAALPSDDFDDLPEPPAPPASAVRPPVASSSISVPTAPPAASVTTSSARVGASPPRGEGRLRSSRSHTTIIVLSVVLVVVWGIAGALYLRSRGVALPARLLPVGQPSATAVHDAEPATQEALARSPEPSPSASTEGTASPTVEASSTADAASSSTPSAMPSAAPSGEASATPSASSQVPVVDVPEASSTLEPTQAWLTVGSSLDANVYVNGELVGRTNRKANGRCGWKNVRLGVEPGPYWISKPLAVELPCAGSLTVSLEPDARLLMLERARRSTLR